MTPQPPNSTAEEITRAIARLKALVVRRRREFILLSVSTFLVVQAIAFFGPATFAAQAALLIQKARSPGPLDADPTEPPTVMSAGVTEEDVNSEIAILTSREVLLGTVEAAGLDRIPQPWYLRVLLSPVREYERLYSRFHGIPEPTDSERAVKSLTRALSAERLKSSNVAVVTLEWGDPRMAKAILDELLRQYLKRHTEVHAHSQVASLFTDQAGRIDKELRDVEDSLQQVKREGGTVDPAAEREVQLKMDAGLREEEETLRRRLAELDGKLRRYDEEQSHGEAEGAANGQILDELKAEAHKLELDQVQMETRYKPDFPLLQENRQKLEKTHQALERERHRVLEHNPLVIYAEHERAAASADRAGVAKRLNMLEEQLEASRKRLLDLDARAVEATRAQRQVHALEQRYLMYLSRGEQARIDSALDQGGLTNVSIVQSASVSPRPVRPKAMIVLLLSIVGGMLVGVLWCAWVEVRAQGAATVLAAVEPST